MIKKLPKRSEGKQTVNDAFHDEVIPCKENQTSGNSFLMKALNSNNQEINFSLSFEEQKYGTAELKENTRSKVHAIQRPTSKKSCKENKEYFTDGQNAYTVAIPKCKKHI